MFHSNFSHFKPKQNCLFSNLNPNAVPFNGCTSNPGSAHAHHYDEISIHTCSILTPHGEQDESSSSFVMSTPMVRDTLKLSDKSHSGQDQLTPAWSDASIFNVKNQNSFTGNHDSSNG